MQILLQTQPKIIIQTSNETELPNYKKNPRNPFHLLEVIISNYQLKKNIDSCNDIHVAHEENVVSKFYVVLNKQNHY